MKTLELIKIFRTKKVMIKTAKLICLCTFFIAILTLTLRFFNFLKNCRKINGAVFRLKRRKMGLSS